MVKKNALSLALFPPLLFLLARCSIAGPASPGPTTDAINFSVGSFPDGTVDIALNVVNSSTLATLYSDNLPGQSAPAMASYSFSPTTVNVTMSTKFHLYASAALYNGTNTGSLTTLTDAGASFTSYSLPLFVVDNPTNPTVFADVQTISSATSLTLSTNFPAGPYYLYQLRQVACQITLTEVGASTYTMTSNDDTSATVTTTQNNL